MSRRRRATGPALACALAWALALPAPAPALAGDPGDSGDAPLPRPTWDWFADFRLRGDRVEDLPAGREDLERGGIRLRTGVRRWFGPAWEVAAGLRASASTRSNDDARIDLDNERPDDLRLDELRVRRDGIVTGRWELGKAPLVPRLGPLLWDDDLRPVGASWSRAWNVRRFDRLALRAAHAHPDHPLERGSASRLSVAQLDWIVREGAPTGGALTLSFVRFDELDGLVESGLARTNAVAAGQPAGDYELVDLRAALRFGAREAPQRLIADLVRNAGAADADESLGWELTWIAGDRRDAGWEIGAVARRLRRDAAVAAFNDDDWWFATATRGAGVWYARALGGRAWLRAGAQVERRDDLDEHLGRVLLDLHFELPRRP